MKLSEHTLAILKNFAGINSGVVLQEGNIQKTINHEQVILFEAQVQDSFPEKVGIYDLNQFLGNISALNNPDLTFDTNMIILDDGEIKLNYHTCSPNLIKTPPEDKQLLMKDPDVSFNITAAALQKLLKIAAMNSLPNISVIGLDGGLFFKTHELKNDSSNYASIRIGDYDGKNFIASFKTEYLRVIPDDYEVEIKIDKFSRWVNKTGTLKYFIGMEKK
jgi:hypothetical protein